MSFKWYEDIEMGGTSTMLNGGYCPPCNLWWMGGHTCPEPRDIEREALIREIVERIVREYGPALDRLGRE